MSLRQALMSKKETEKVNRKKLPSQYGSHASMIVDHATVELEDPVNFVCLEDENGFYVTERNRLDNGLADPNRYATSRLN